MAFIITNDTLNGGPQRVTIGHDNGVDAVNRLLAGEGEPFRLTTDDGRLLAEGRYLNTRAPDDDDAESIDGDLGPLSIYPFADHLTYADADGRWTAGEVTG
jgi:hypothetical protein